MVITLATCPSDLSWLNAPGPLLLGDDAGVLYLAQRVADRAALLRATGVIAGQIVMAPDAPARDLVLTLLALAQLGAGVFPYRSGRDPSELLTLAHLAGVEWRWDPETATLIPLAPQTTPAASAALLIQTSGSSGQPQIVMHSAAGLYASASRVNARLAVTAAATWLCCLRLSHIGGAAMVYRAALAGARLRLHDGFDARTVRRELESHHVTHVSLVPPMLARLLDLGDRAPPTLRVVLVGGQALSRPLAERALAAGWPLQLTYGMTETGSQIATSGPLAAQPDALDTSLAGALLPDMALAATDCETDRPARLRVRGPLLMLGYANPERRPGQGLDADGWFTTADLGCLTEAGQLRLLGRADDRRVIGGINVSLTQVTQMVQNAPGVADAQIVATADPIWGHRLTVVYAGTCDERELAHWCQTQLHGPTCPRAFVRLKRLPLLDSGKYDRRRMGELVTQLESG